ncbi:MAG TPA: GDSL-type esterase/lipase family protein [Chloroflexota bacterium]
MDLVRPSVTRPGMFGQEVAADSRRSVFDAHNEALLAQGIPIDAVFIGDSITDMWALNAFFEGTSGLIANRGIGGDSTPFVRRRFHADVLQLQPRIVVIEIGVNNTWDLDTPWDRSVYRPPDEIEDEIVGDVDAMVVSARERGIVVALCSILPTDIPFVGTTGVRNELILRANNRLRDVAARHAANYVDYHANLTAEDGVTLRAGLAEDGLHPHVVGYRIMARTLLEALSGAGITFIKPRSA